MSSPAKAQHAPMTRLTATPKLAQQIRHAVVADMPDGQLFGMAFLTMEMAEQALAEENMESAQMLVELAMSVFFTASRLVPSASAAIEKVRRRLDQLTDSVVAATPDDEGDDEAWPRRAR